MATTLAARIEPNYLLIEGVGVIANSEDEKRWADACYEELLRQGSQRVLIDQRKIEFKSSISDQCNVVSYYNEEFELQIRKFSIALLVNPEEKKLHKFWELYANNRGYRWKVFTEKCAADAFLNTE